jgi:hypothetical protein
MKKLLTILFVVFCSVQMFAKEGKDVSNILDINSNLSVEELHKEVLRLAHERHNLINNLIRQLRYGKNLNKEKKIRICFLLGQYRASEAAKDLLNIIALENKIKPGQEYRRSLWERYPAFEALERIGMPAVRHILIKLGTESDINAMRLEVILIRGLYGKEIGKMVLEKAIAKQADKEKAENITKAMGLIRWSKRK